MLNLVENSWQVIVTLVIAIVGSLLAVRIKGSWKRIIIICVVLIAFVILLPLVMQFSKPTPPVLPPTPTPTPTPTATPELLYFFTGTGQKMSPTFTLESGTTIFRMTHDGHSNFIVHLLDNKLETVKLLVNEIGAFDGAVAVVMEEGTFGAQPGTYVLEIDADGKWTIGVEQ